MKAARGSNRRLNISWRADARLQREGGRCKKFSPIARREALCCLQTRGTSRARVSHDRRAHSVAVSASTDRSTSTSCALQAYASVLPRFGYDGLEILLGRKASSRITAKLSAFALPTPSPPADGSGYPRRPRAFAVPRERLELWSMTSVIPPMGNVSGAERRRDFTPSVSPSKRQSLPVLAWSDAAAAAGTGPCRALGPGQRPSSRDHVDTWAYTMRHLCFFDRQPMERLRGYFHGKFPRLPQRHWSSALRRRRLSSSLARGYNTVAPIVARGLTPHSLPGSLVGSRLRRLAP